MRIDSKRSKELRNQAVAVWTRDLDTTDQAGRLHIARAVRNIFRAEYDTKEVSLDLLENGLRPLAILKSIYLFAIGIFLGKPLALQCALFGGVSTLKGFTDFPEAPNFIYLDGVRTLVLLRQLRVRWPNAKIVCDLDDLMSRRMNFWIRHRVGISFGYAEKLFGAPMVNFLSKGTLARLLILYERFALSRAEREILHLSDAVVLISSVDAQEMRQRSPEYLHSKIHVVPPPVMAKGAPIDRTPPYRLVFLGTDKLVQNRLTIEYLLDIWRTDRPRTSLHIFGIQKRAYKTIPPNVVFHGFVEDLNEIYDGHSVLLTPSMIGGGVKTKVLEAFSYGVPVIGTNFTFEGMNLPAYPLIFEDRHSLVAAITNLDALTESFSLAVRIGTEFLANELTPAKFAARWRQLAGSRPSAIQDDLSCLLLPSPPIHISSTR